MSAQSIPRRLTQADLAKLYAAGEKVVMFTCYDASFARLLDGAGVETLLIGDSLGNVIQGHDTTLPVTVADIAYHVAAVKRGSDRPFIIADMPFGSYQEAPEQAFRNAVTLMAAGAQMVKLEGGAFMAETVRFLVERGVPVCAHIGLTPQAVHQLGGYRVQGRSEEGAATLKADALALEQAGAALMVMEMVPSAVAADVTASLTTMATIGIGGGVDCHGQVLVLHDLIGVSPGKRPRFAKNFMEGASSIDEAVTRYVTDVRESRFPGPEHSY